jgi:hypothetical protein
VQIRYRKRVGLSKYIENGFNANDSLNDNLEIDI